MAEINKNNFENTSNFFGKFFKGQQKTENIQRSSNVLDKKMAGLLGDIYTDVQQELKDISIVNKQGFNQLESFVKYENLLSQMEPLLQKVVDPSIQVSKDEGAMLQSFLDEQDTILESMNKRLKQDKDLQEELLSVQKKSGVELRNISYRDSEVADFAKENGLSVGKLMSTMSDRMGFISTSLGSEAKSALGSALLGPFYDIGKNIIDTGKITDKLKDIFSKKAEKDTEFQDEMSKSESIGRIIEKKNLKIQQAQLNENGNIRESLDGQTQILSDQFEDLEDSMGGGKGGFFGKGIFGKLASIGTWLILPLLILAKKMSFISKFFNMLPGVGLITRTLAKIPVIGKLLKFIPGLGLILTGITALIGGIKGFLSVGEFFSTDRPSIGQMVSAVLGGIVSALTFGFLDAKKVSNIIFDFGGKLLSWLSSGFTALIDIITNFDIGSIASFVITGLTSIKDSIGGKLKSFFGIGSQKTAPVSSSISKVSPKQDLALVMKANLKAQELKNKEMLKAVLSESQKSKQEPITKQGVTSRAQPSPSLKSIPVVVDNFGLILINSGVM